MAQPPLDISGTAAPVGIDYSGDNSTANGGKGDPVDGLAFLLRSDPIHIHSHLAVVLNGQLLVVPVNIGRVPATLPSWLSLSDPQPRRGRPHAH